MKIILVMIVAVILISFFRRKKKTKQEAIVASHIPEDNMDNMLQEHVSFYNSLQADHKTMFRNRVQHFLDTTRITGIGEVEITELDKLYVGSSAIIPIFHFEDWAYNNLDEVLLYPGTFTKDYSTEDAARNVLGMVGDGAMNRMMILSQPALRAGFEQHGNGNTGIHEFVHLLDKADGATDGIPEYMIPKDLIHPWMQEMHKTINEIRHSYSDLNPYAGTNEAEFFAVLSEYFFQKPEFLEEHHPELYAILVQVYRIQKDDLK